ncbi:MAG: NAD(P)/FAD-dependent oxidoreductase [Lachnospiraceae bacterium]|nr:NAD(P)/FAD-dependent oxidoreductase [Lachnospiraceae bacterium]
MNYPKLFSRGRIGNVELKNRIVMPPMGTGFASASGEASDEIIRYYEERAKGGCGLIITEITRIDNETGVGCNWQLNATSPKYVQRLLKLADAVHRHDTKIFLQLHHPGRETPSHLLGGQPPVAPSPIACKVIGEVPRELTTAECEDLVKKFISGAVIAMRSNMDGVELHAAHGYLINQFLSPYTNKRTDKYGGDFTNRMRFITEIISGIQAACGPNFPISVRISAEEYVEGGLKLEDGVKIAQYLEKLGISAINVSCGTYESGYTVIEPYYMEEGWKKHLAKTIRANVSIPVIAVSNIKHPAAAEQMLEEDVSDFVGIARGQLVDPQWGNKAKYGQEDVLRKCIGCLYCFRTANMGRPIACTVNPVLGRELIYNEETLVRDGNGRSVAVIGGGPAGMQAALVLGRRGFQVTLFEKGSTLGGTLNIADKPPHKTLITELTETLKHEIQAVGVTVRLNTPATVEAVKELNPYGVMIATGGMPIVPPVPGIDMEHVCKAEEVLSGQVMLKGKKVLIMGGGVTGLETAEILSKENQVTVVDMLDAVATTLYPSVRAGLLGRLQKGGVKIITGHRINRIQEGFVELQNVKDHTSDQTETDAVVLAVGVRPDRDMISEFYNAFDKVTTVGDASRSGLIGDALKEANDKAFVF